MSAAASRLTARPATIADLDAAAALVRSEFATPRGADALRWKVEGHGGRHGASTVLVDDTGDIVGFLGQMPVRVALAGRPVPALQTVDMVVRRDRRGLHAYLALLRESTRRAQAAGVALAYGFANAQAAEAARTLLGQERVAPLPLLVRPLSGRAPASAGPVACIGAPLLAAGLRCLDGTLTRRRNTRVTPIDRFDSRFDTFWNETRGDYPIQLVRDADYLNWRYVGVPDNEYHLLALDDAAGGRVRGYAVWRLRHERGLVRGSLAELTVPRRGGPAAARLLLDAVLRELRAREADVAECWMLPSTPLRPVLQQRGFLPRRAAGAFSVTLNRMTNNARTPDATQARNWYLSLGDSDTV